MAYNPPSPRLNPQTIPTPVPASTLLLSILQTHLTSHHHNGHASRTRTLRSGFEELDEYVLKGGFERGTVVGLSGSLSGDVGGGGEEGIGRLVSLHLVATVLLSSSLARASIIDTTGSFPLSLLAKIIRHRKTSSLYLNRKDSRESEATGDIDDEVQKILGRVAISRVFDIEGVWEVVSEISRDYDSSRTQHIAESTVFNAESHRLAPKENDVDTALGSKPREYTVTKMPEKEKKVEIGNSQSEDEEEFEVDLRESNRIPDDENDRLVENLIESDGFLPSQDPALSIGARDKEIKGTTEIIVIDNMTTCISDLFSRREKNSAHTILTTLSRSLHSFSQTNSILTLLLNDLIIPSSRSLPQKPSPSVFTSTAARPALGRIFDAFTALHLLVTKVPKTIRDAAIFYASPPSPDPYGENDIPDEQMADRGRPQPVVQCSHVIEVIKDHTADIDAWLDDIPTAHPTTGDTSNTTSTTNSIPLRRPLNPTPNPIRNLKSPSRKPRTQRWTAYDISPDGVSLVDAFPDMSHSTTKSNSRNSIGMGKAQVHIVKQFPFGRRI